MNQTKNSSVVLQLVNLSYVFSKFCSVWFLTPCVSLLDRIVEDQVKELRDVIRTVCGTNTSSTTTTVTTQASVEDEDGVEDAAEAAKGDNSSSHSEQPGMIHL